MTETERPEKENMPIWENILYRSRRSWLRAGTFSFLFAFFFMIGRRLERYGSIPMADNSMWESIFLLWFATMLITVLFWTLLESFHDRESRENSRSRRRRGFLHDPLRSLPPAARRLLVWMLFMAVYLFFLAAVNPGFFVYDASEELSMFASRSFTTHHPLVHVLLLGGVISAVRHVTGSVNAGILAYCILQAAALSAAFTAMLTFMKKRGAGRVLLAVSFLFLAFFPTVVMFVLCTCKDGIFSAALILLVISLLKMFGEPETFWRSRRDMAVYLISATVMALFRHNGVCALAVFIPFLIGWTKGHRKQAAVLAVLPLILWAVISGGLGSALHAKGGEYQELLTVPIQQLARCYVYEGEDFSPEDRAAMNSLMREEDWKHYTPKLSDQVKLHFNNEAFAADRGKYISLWLRTGLTHPATYLNAWFLTSYGFWYPDAVIDCYEGNTVFTFVYQDSSYFGYETEQPGVRNSLIPPVDAFFRWLSLDPAVQKLPVIHLLFSPGAMFWLFAFAMCFCADIGKKAPVKACVPLFLTWLTALLGPCSLPRYVVYLWFGFPLLLFFLFGRNREETDRAE